MARGESGVHRVLARRIPSGEGCAGVRECLAAARRPARQPITQVFRCPARPSEQPFQRLISPPGTHESIPLQVKDTRTDASA